MSSCNLKNPPVFIIGMPRSGTTIIFEKFVELEQYGWLSNYSEMYPGLPSLNLLCRLLNNKFISLRGRKKQYSSVRFGNRYLPQAVEAYAFWDMYARGNFSRDFLLNAKAGKDEIDSVAEAISKTLKYQHKDYFATKLTGPGRIAYLDSIFPDARFIHVVRDGRAVVNSLLRVGFWKEKGGFDAPFWTNGLSEDELIPWKENRHPAILTAIQWLKVISSIREEAKELPSHRYLEVRYEDFVSSPEKCVNEFYKFSGIVGIDEVIGDPDNAATMTDMNNNSLAGLDASIRKKIDELLQPALVESGYEV